MTKVKQKKKKWTRWRHKFYRHFLNFAFGWYCKLKYNFRVTKCKEARKRQFLILFNHQTGFDQFFVGLAFPCAVYYVASEDIFSLGLASSIIKHLVAPIPIKKQATDVHAVMNCLRVAREGGTIAMAPEGNRTFPGEPVFINPAIAPLARKLGLPIALYRIEGGYGVQPRWSDVVRRGSMRGYVYRILEPEEYANMTDDELCTAIREGLAVNEVSLEGVYRHKKNAEFLERAIYVCPKCGLSEFESHNDLFTCKRCGLTARHLPTKELEGVGTELPFRSVAEWYHYQCDFINDFQSIEHVDEPLYEDTASLYSVIPYKKKSLIKKAVVLKLFGNRLQIDDQTYSFDDISAMSVLGKNKLNIYVNKEVYQIKSDKIFCALKYLNLYYRYRNIAKGDSHGKFLGL
jgi:1-acyl-sn-glycerol-3-phosphate acyltransferase